MQSLRRVVAARVGWIATVVLAVGVLAASIAGAGAGGAHAAARPVGQGPREQNVCGMPGPGVVHCLAKVLKRGRSSTGAPLLTSSPTPIGLTPAAVQSAYHLDTLPTAGAGQTIAIVDAYDDSNAEADLAAFSNQYGLPACTTANGCFTKVNQRGGTTYPVPNAVWSLEISLDVQWAHAVAPGARILLVEADTASWDNIFVAEDYASAHAAYVSNSFGAPEFPTEGVGDAHFATPGVSYFVASGDAGALPEYPSTSPGVISVGGTTLNFDSNGAAEETAWSLSGGGCSSYETAAPAQAAFSQYGALGCGGSRATPDVSLVGDPTTGVSVFDSTTYMNQSGWWQMGGTSAATPMFAARAAVAGLHVDAATVYGGNTIPFRDITSGSNGFPATVGYDLVTGRGSWAYSTSSSTPPGAPSGLVANGDTSSVSLQWTAPAQTGTAPVSSYSIYRGTSAGAETPLASGIAGTSFTDTSAVAGAVYYYVVTAVSTAGESVRSSEVSGALAPPLGTVPPTSSTAPQSLVAAAGNAAVRLSWAPPTSPSGAFTYNVYRGTASGTETRVKSGLGTTSYNDTGRANGTTYFYKVTAVSGGKESSASNEVQATPATVPGTPGNVSAKTSTTGGVMLTWKAPSSGGSAITAYVIYRSTASHTEVLYLTVPCSATSASACSFSDTSTSPGVVYYYQLGAVNSVGAGRLSSQVQTRAL